MYSFSTKYIGKKLILLKTVTSTNSYLLNYNGTLEEGTTVVAEEQTKARGRLNRKWFSTANSLTFSVLLKPKINPIKLPQLTQISSLAIAKAIENMCFLNTMIKWPNDIYINDKKCCGILTETRFNSIPIVVLGVGINVNANKNDIPYEIKKKASSLYIETNKTWNLEKLLSALLSEIEHHYELWLNNSFSTFVSEIEHRFYLRNKKVMVNLTNDYVLRGKVLGINSNGYLIIADQNDKVHQLSSGEVILCS